ncbi:MAG TPA: aldo/keto reductase [Candidatus Saccharimonadales bacterium]|nr:aldo/keto reductase [Candidatus Saccharimonadales bacterium]
MQTYELANGQKIPAIGFGTWEVKPSDTVDAVRAAIADGYRLIDTAKIYGNEREVGEAVEFVDVPREELFITTKLWNEDQGYDSTRQAFETSMEKLGLDYLDLYLIHWPATARRSDSWRAMSELCDEGLVKAIGVSNFTVRHLEELKSDSLPVPHVNQVEFHPFIYEQQKELLEYCKQHDILIEAYSPLSRAVKLDNEAINRIADRSGKSPSQVILRWCLQHGTVPLPRSTNPEHIKENIAVFDFELTDEDMSILDALSDGQRVTWDPEDMG